MKILGERVYLTADGKHVREGHPDAAFLAYAQDDEVPDSVLAELGRGGPSAKMRKPAADKSRKPAADKGVGGGDGGDADAGSDHPESSKTDDPADGDDK